MWRKQQEEVSTEIDPNETYTKSHLNAVADAILREDSRSELCRTCGERGVETGFVKSEPQYDENKKPLKDERGIHLHIEFPEISCPQGHNWFQGEGQARGIGGENPILFEEHFQSRRKREIFTQEGVPDPSIVSGLYNRSHPQGRRVNSPLQRKRNGASYYR